MCPTDIADDGVLIFQDDHPSEPITPIAQDSVPWRILIVDDDVDVHVVTKFALSNTNFHGRRLCFMHAYSAPQAMAILRTTPDIAMVLLDVIMETPDAGLQLARQIREDLHNDLVRIVLRTGQPGQAREHSIIVDYDINDFWCKADLTTRKLFTTVISSLRAYATLAAAASERDALAAALTRARQLQHAADQIMLMLTLDVAGCIVEVNDYVCQLAEQPRQALLGKSIGELQLAPFPEPLASVILASLAHTGAWAGELRAVLPGGTAIVLRCAVLSIKDEAGVALQYAAVATRLA